jgi:hypothetical protein
VRDHPVRLLTLVLLLTAADVRGQSEPVRIELAAEQSLRAGSHAAIEVVVQLPPGSDAPLLLTPSVEGDAVEVVRGRLSRPDAKPLPPDGLRFEVPVRARSEGTAILRIELMTYVCAQTCQRVVTRASQVLRVQSN